MKYKSPKQTVPNRGAQSNKNMWFLLPWLSALDFRCGKACRHQAAKNGSRLPVQGTMDKACRASTCPRTEMTNPFN